MAGLNLKIGVNVLQATREIDRLGRNISKLGARVSATNTQLNAGAAATSRFGTAAGAAATSVLQLVGALSVLGVGAAAKAAISFTSDFERSIAEINTILPEGGVKLDEYRKKLLKLSTESSKSLQDLSEALYQVISSGIPTEDGPAGAFAVLTASQKAAVAGLSSTENAVKATVAVLNSYEQGLFSATDVTDKLLTTVREGQIRFDDLARGIGRVAPIAANAGVSLDDLLGTIATITQAGVSPRETITGLRNLINSITAPTRETTQTLERFNAVQRATGRETVDLSAEALRNNGLLSVLQNLQRATGGSTEALREFFPNIRALLPGLILIGSKTEVAERKIQAMGDSIGYTNEAAGKIDATFSETFEKVISNIGRLSVESIDSGEDSILSRLNRDLLDLNSYLGTGQALKSFQEFFEGVDGFIRGTIKFINDFSLELTALLASKVFVSLGGVGLMTGAATAANVAFGALGSALGRLAPLLTVFNVGLQSVGKVALSTASLVGGALVRSLRAAGSAALSASIAFGGTLLKSLKAVGAFLLQGSLRVGLLALDAALIGFMKTLNAFGVASAAVLSGLGSTLRSLLTVGASVTLIERLGPAMMALPARAFTAGIDLMIGSLARLEFALGSALVSVRRFSVRSAASLGFISKAFSALGAILSQGVTVGVIEGLGPILLAQFSAARLAVLGFIKSALVPLQAALVATGVKLNALKKGLMIFIATARSAGTGFALSAALAGFTKSIAPAIVGMKAFVGAATGAVVPSLVAMKAGFVSTSLRILDFSKQAVANFGAVTKSAVTATLSAGRAAATGGRAALAGTAAATSTGVAVGLATVGTAAGIGSARRAFQEFGTNLSDSGGKFRDTAQEIRFLGFEFTFFADVVRATGDAFVDSFTGTRKFESAIGALVGSVTVLTTTLIDIPTRVGAGLAGALSKITDWFGITTNAADNFFMVMDIGIFDYLRQLTEIQEETERLRKELKNTQEEMEEEAQDLGFTDFQERADALQNMREGELIQLDTAEASEVELFNLDGDFIGPQLEKAEDNIERANESIIALLTGNLDAFAEDPSFAPIFGSEPLELRAEIKETEGLTGALTKFFSGFNRQGKETLLTFKQLNARLKQQIISYTTVDEVTAQTISRRVTRLFLEKQIAAVLEKQNVITQQEGLDKESDQFKELELRKKNLEDQLKLLNIQTDRDAITRATTANTIKGLNVTDKKANREKLINRLLTLQEKARRKIAKQDLDKLKTDEKVIRNQQKQLELFRSLLERSREQVEEVLSLNRALNFDVGGEGRIDFSKPYKDAIKTLIRLEEIQTAFDGNQLKVIEDLREKRKEIAQSRQSAKDDAARSGFDRQIRKIDELVESLRKLNVSGPKFTGDGGVVDVDDLKKKLKDAKDNIKEFSKAALDAAEFQIEFDADQAEEDLDKAALEVSERINASLSTALKASAESFGEEMSVGFESRNRGVENFIDQFKDPLDRERIRDSIQSLSRSLGIGFEAAGQVLQERLSRSAKIFGGSLRSEVESADSPFARIVDDFIEKVQGIKFVRLGEDISTGDGKTFTSADRADVVRSTRRFSTSVGDIFLEAANSFKEEIERANRSGDIVSVEKAERSLEDLQRAIAGIGDSPDKFIEQLERIQKILRQEFVRARDDDGEDESGREPERRPRGAQGRPSSITPEQAAESASGFAGAKEAGIELRKTLEEFKETVIESGDRFRKAVEDAVSNVEVFNVGAIVGSVLNPLLEGASELAEKTRNSVEANLDDAADQINLAIDAAQLNPAVAASAKLFVDGAAAALNAASSVIIGAFETGARLVGNTLMRVLDTVGDTLMAPIDMLFGSLGDALAVLDPTSGESAEEREREERERRKEAAEAEKQRIEDEQKRTRDVLANIKALKDAGASNEEIARAQAELVKGEADSLNEEREQEKSAIQTLADRIDAAVQFAVNIMNQLPAILGAFLEGVIQSLPVIFESLTTALISALDVVAQRLPELVEVLTAELVEALPLIIKALVDLIPVLIESILISITEILKGLPDIIIAFVDALVASIPDIITALIDTIPDLIAALAESLPIVISVLIMSVPRIIFAVLKGIPRIISAVVRGIPNVVRALIRGVARGMFETLKSLASVFNDTGRIFRNVGRVLNEAWRGFIRLIDYLTLGRLEDPERTVGFTAAGSGIGAVAGGIAGFALGGPAGAALGAKIGTGLGALGGAILSAFHEGGQVVSSMRDAYGESLFRSMGVKGFSEGGMVGDTMRQYFRASLKDDVPALLQVGEAVLTPSAVSAIGGADAVDSLNSGGSIAPAPVNVNVGINPDGAGMSSVAAALLPMLIKSMNVSTSSAGKGAYGVLGLGGRTTLGYRTVRGVD